MSLPKLATFEKDIENEIREKAASISDIAEAAGTPGPIEVPKMKSSLPALLMAGGFVLVLLLVIIFFLLTERTSESGPSTRRTNVATFISENEPAQPTREPAQPVVPTPIQITEDTATTTASTTNSTTATTTKATSSSQTLPQVPDPVTLMPVPTFTAVSLALGKTRGEISALGKAYIISIKDDRAFYTAFIKEGKEKSVYDDFKVAFDSVGSTTPYKGFIDAPTTLRGSLVRVTTLAASTTLWYSYLNKKHLIVGTNEADIKRAEEYLTPQ